MKPYLPARVPPALAMEVYALLSDVTAFSRLHTVQDKESKRQVPFEPLPMQEKIFEAVEAGHKRIAVIKARQVTATTGAKMVLHHLAYVSQHASMHAIVSMRADSATALLDDHRRWMHHPPTLLQRPHSPGRTQITFTDTGASLQAFTSRSTTGLRSFQPAAALISEAAYAPDLSEVIAQADAAVGEGLLIIESTSRNPGDHFSSILLGAPENGWHVLTLWWWEHPAYTDADSYIPEDFEASLEEGELELREAYNLTLGQLHWRRRKVLSIGPFKFLREYPASLDDCFMTREGGYLEDQLLRGIYIVEHLAIGQHSGKEIEAPHPHDRYVVGVDISGGVGGDYSTLCVVSVATMQPVFTMRSNTSTPATWAHDVIRVASRYNNALVLAESNNHGHAFLLEMANCRYRNLWCHPSTSKAWTTTLQSKLDAFDTLREALPIIKIMDRATWLELRSLTIPAGKLTPEAPPGGYDDSAIAVALAYRALRDIPASWRTRAIVTKGVRVTELIDASRSRRIRSKGLPF